MHRSFAGKLLFIAIFLSATFILLKVSQNRSNSPVHYADAIEHFKYGSIGAEVNGYPYLVWRELPTIYKKELPRGWETFGFIHEPRKELPVGISVRKYGVNRVGFNCAACHTSRIQGQANILLGAPADQLDLQHYLRFLVNVSKDENFSADKVFASAKDNQRPFSQLDKIIYRFYVIPKIRSELKGYEAEDGAWMATRADHGPGRTDAGNPWRQKFGMHPERDLLNGAVDMPSMWNQRIRANLWMHWDGNNSSLAERNLSAALAGGATEKSLDHASIKRVAAWAIDAPSPRYPQPVSVQSSELGRKVFGNYCASCHQPDGPKFGKVISLADIGTDPDRVTLFSKEMVKAFGNVGQGTPWQFKNYRQSDGYVAAPLDGIWARAPYLHNGSVPTLQDLLSPPEKRPKIFLKGCSNFDFAKIGRSCDQGFEFDTSLRGNRNTGHVYGTDLTAPEQAALIEYLKTL